MQTAPLRDQIPDHLAETVNRSENQPPPAAPTQKGREDAGAPGGPAAGSVELGCWNREGVYGNNTCAELKSLVHCRNCEVYSGAAAMVLNGPLPGGYREDWSRHFAMPNSRRELGSGTVILFRLGSEWLALPTRCLQEIADRRPIHSIPHHRPFILGLANVRGELLTCISLAHFLGLGPLPDRRALRTNYFRLLVVNWNSSRVCFPADEVRGPHRLPQEESVPAPTPLSKVGAVLTNCLLRNEKKAVGLLDASILCSTLNRSLS